MIELTTEIGVGLVVGQHLEPLRLHHIPGGPLELDALIEQFGADFVYINQTVMRWSRVCRHTPRSGPWDYGEGREGVGKSRARTTL